MGIQQLETISQFEEKVLGAQDDKIIVVHPFFPRMSDKHFVPQLESLSNTNPDLQCYGIDLKKVETKLKELHIRGLPVVMFFKNGEKIAEILGSTSPQSINLVLQKGLSSKLNEPDEEPIPKPTQMDENEDADPAACKVCRLERIVNLLPSHPHDGTAHVQREIDLHMLVANAENCNYCRFLMQTCQSDPTLYERVDSVGGNVLIITKRDKGLALLDLVASFKEGVKKVERFRSRILQMTTLIDSKDGSTYFSGRTIPNEADLTICRSWLSNCRKNHDRDCRRRSIDSSEFGMRLIDVRNRSVATAPNGATYAALSYVWGGAEQLILSDATFQRLTNAEGLSDSHADIPKTIRDAMFVASSLGFQYLWVDALCIKQDDEANKQLQIKNMDKVYSGATLTIVSTGLNANSEIPGLRQASRTPNQVVCKVGGIQLVNSLPTLSQALLASSWDRRGWTLQEKTLSKRLLIFTEFQVYWHCNSAVCAEDTNLELSKDNETLRKIITRYDDYSMDIRRIYKLHPRDLPDYQYMQLLRSYVVRKLTSQDDAYNAFVGILNNLAPRLGDDHFGLPTQKFGWGMLWKFDSHFSERRRKKFPSWSWVGWEGDSDMELDENGIGSVSRIQWWRFDETGALVLINRGEEGEPEYTNEFFGVDSSSPPPDPRNISNSYSDHWPESLERSHILRFWTSKALLTIGRTPVRVRSENCSEYPVYVPERKASVSTVILNNAWREAHGDQIDAIFVSHAGEPYMFHDEVMLWAMLIEWDHDLAYRVQHLSYPLRLPHWKSAKPRFELISLA